MPTRFGGTANRPGLKLAAVKQRLCFCNFRRFERSSQCLESIIVTGNANRILDIQMWYFSPETCRRSRKGWSLNAACDWQNGSVYWSGQPHQMMLRQTNELSGEELHGLPRETEAHY